METIKLYQFDEMIDLATIRNIQVDKKSKRWQFEIKIDEKLLSSYKKHHRDRKSNHNLDDYCMFSFQTNIGGEDFIGHSFAEGTMLSNMLLCHSEPIEKWMPVYGNCNPPLDWENNHTYIADLSNQTQQVDIFLSSGEGTEISQSSDEKIK